MAIKLTVHRDRLNVLIKQKQERALTAAGVFLRDEMRKVVSVPVVKVNGRVTVRSKPGEPPRLETGFGRSKINYRVAQDGRGTWHLKISVAVNAAYMLYLEYGTRRIKPRPWLVSTWKKCQPQVEKIIAMVGNS
jgi:HK97 gp10 family phage protein